VNIRHGSGKLLWRIDWPMRWKALEVTIEPFGEDHNSKGGSYQTGAKIAQEIFGIEPPGGAPYAWLQLKGGAAMHSSGGKAFPVSEAVRGFPPSILWWMVARHPPRDPIQFDPSESYLKEASLLRRVFLTDDTRLKETLAAVESACPVPTALKVFSAEHLAMAAQLGNFNPIETLSVLGRSVRTDEPVPELSVQELASIKYWVSGAGSEYRIQVRSSNDPRPVLASAIQSAIHDLCSRLQSIPWTAKSIHNEVHETARSLKIEPIDLFTALYLLTISKRKGPKIGWFLEALGREKTILLLS
jgi:lysyl-tRNA synthetase class 1